MERRESVSHFSFYALLCGLLLVSVLGMAQNTPFKKFIGPGNRYSFYYPPDWSVVASQDIVDLRGFSDRNTGCVFELQQLAGQKRLLDTVFVVDSSTDIRLLESTIRAAGSDIDARCLHFEKVESETATGRERVYRSLCGV